MHERGVLLPKHGLKGTVDSAEKGLHAIGGAAAVAAAGAQQGGGGFF